MALAALLSVHDVMKGDTDLACGLSEQFDHRDHKTVLLDATYRLLIPYLQPRRTRVQILGRVLPMGLPAILLSLSRHLPSGNKAAELVAGLLNYMVQHPEVELFQEVCFGPVLWNAISELTREMRECSGETWLFHHQPE